MSINLIILLLTVRSYNIGTNACDQYVKSGIYKLYFNVVLK